MHGSRISAGCCDGSADMKHLLDEPALRALARGCAVLGTGGGGDSRIGLLQAMQAVQEFGPTELVDLDELPSDVLIMPCGVIGAPTVAIEKIGNGNEGVVLRDHLAGISPSPYLMTDERGNVIVLRPISGAWLERLARAAAVEFGGSAVAAEYAMTAEQARGATVRGTVSLAIKIGEAMAAAADPVAALIAATGGFTLVSGKVTDVERRTTKGFVRGSVVIEGLGDDAGRLLRLELQNENLVALEQGTVRASVPDLISVLDSETADAIATERVKYGQRVTVIAMACDPIWRTLPGLQMAGPHAFGYDFDYAPVEELAGADA